MNGQTIKIKPNLIQKIGGLVILPLEEYEKLCQRATEIFSLKTKKATDLDCLIRDGEIEYKAGKYKTIKSLSDLD